MIHFIDQTSEKNHHAVFNSSCIKMLQLIYPSQTITHYGIASNQLKTAELLAQSELEQVIFNPIYNPKTTSSNKLIRFLNLIRKERNRYNMFEKIFESCSQSDLIFHSITTFTAFYGLKKLSIKFETPVIATLHGDLDFLYNTTNVIEKLVAFVYKKNFKLVSPNFYYLLLNKISKHALISSGFLKQNEILEIDHPYNSLNICEKNKNSIDQNPITFGHIGSMEVVRKRSHLIYELAKKFECEINKSELNFNVVGLVTPEILVFKNSLVNEIVGNQTPNKPGYLDRFTYENEMNKLDYSVFFYPSDQYIFRTSGAIADAIGAALPFIVLKHPIFDYIFSVAGNVGYVCDNLDEIVQIINKINLREPQLLIEYQTQRNNLLLFQNNISVPTVALDLKAQMIKYGLY